MILKEINSKDKAGFEFVQHIYIESFPPNERRPLSELKKLADTKNEFQIDIITESDNKRVGFITHWDFDTFTYIEHFAIDTEFRNGGYGARVMNSFIAKAKHPLLLEVELPDNKTAERRISFYRRLGFNLWNIPYIQPPYEPKFEPLPMALMTYGEIDLDNDFKAIKDNLYQKVYKAVEV